MDLFERLDYTAFRWHQRAAIRKWDDIDNSDAPMLVIFQDREEAEDVEGPPEGSRSAIISARLQVVESEKNQQEVSIRAAIRIDDDLMASVQDLEVRYVFTGSPLTDDEIMGVVAGWGGDYVMGHLRSAATASSSEIGLPPLVLGPGPGFPKEEAARMLETAREAAASETGDKPSSSE